MTTVHRQPSGYLVVCKGAPEFLLHSDVVLAEAAGCQAALAKANEYAGAGTSCSRGRGQRSSGDRPASAAEAESNLQLLGLVGMADPAKAVGAGHDRRLPYGRHHPHPDHWRPSRRRPPRLRRRSASPPRPTRWSTAV